ncbi:MAG: hypothetical protein NTV81_00285, partial [Candidatus Komeilibacteria bacterium]|nr:hypothetical protein [Candidatus Komeilibacteria bacterium]
PPSQLIDELKKWEEELEKNIQTIGEEKIRQRNDLGWVFDEGGDPHFEHHLKQIKKSLNYGDN